MPELPEIVGYLEALEPRIVGHRSPAGLAYLLRGQADRLQIGVGPQQVGAGRGVAGNGLHDPVGQVHRPGGLAVLVSETDALAVPIAWLSKPSVAPSRVFRTRACSRRNAAVRHATCSARDWRRRLPASSTACWSRWVTT